MNKIRQFYIRNQKEITWFLIGWLTLGGLHSLGQHDYVGAVISFGLVWLNYSINR